MTVLITGGGSGIGAATARRLARRCPVIVADRNTSAADTIAREINAGGGKALVVEVDVASSRSVKAMMDRLATEASPIEGLFNNAGITVRRPIEEIAEDDWDRLINTHVKGTLLVSQAVLPQMLARGRGVIVNSSSDYAVIGVRDLAAYCAAKTAVYSMTKAMAVEFTAKGIRVNAVGPGPIDTPLLRAGRLPDEAAARLEMHKAKIPMRRLGQPEEVAAVVDFLMSEHSAYIAGQLLQPNGGMVVW